MSLVLLLLLLALEGLLAVEFRRKAGVAGCGRQSFLAAARPSPVLSTGGYLRLGNEEGAFGEERRVGMRLLGCQG